MIKRTYISLLVVALFAAGCSKNIVDVPPPTGAGASSYGWNMIDTIIYTSLQPKTGATSTITLHFAATAESDRYQAIENFNSSGSDTLLLHSTNDSLTVSGLTERSIIRVPSGYALSGVRYDTIDRPRNIRKILAFGDTGKQVVASDDSNHVFYSSDAGASWSLSTGLSISAKDVIADFVYGPFNSKTVVAAATVNGLVYISSNGGQSWSLGYAGKLGGIRAICSSSDGIFASIIGNGIFRMASQPSLVAPGLPSIDSSATLLATSRAPLSSTVTFLASDASGGIYYINPDSDVYWKTPPAAVRYSSATPRVITRATDTTFIISLQTSTSTGITASWIPTEDTFHVLTNSFYTLAAVDAFNLSAVLLANERGNCAIFKTANQVVTTAPSVPLSSYSVLNAITLCNGNAFAGTSDSGIYNHSFSNGSGGPWAKLHSSPAQRTVVHTLLPLEFRLLGADDAGIHVGGTWDAGKIFSDSLGVSVSLRADVDRYIDSLKLTNGLIFSSIFVVNYRFADQAGGTATSPVQWTIYFAKGEGPVLIDEIEEPSGILLSRTYRSSK